MNTENDDIKDRNANPGMGPGKGLDQNQDSNQFPNQEQARKEARPSAATFPEQEMTGTAEDEGRLKNLENQGNPKNQEEPTEPTEQADRVDGKQLEQQEEKEEQEEQEEQTGEDAGFNGLEVEVEVNEDEDEEDEDEDDEEEDEEEEDEEEEEKEEEDDDDDDDEEEEEEEKEDNDEEEEEEEAGSGTEAEDPLKDGEPAEEAAGQQEKEEEVEEEEDDDEEEEAERLAPIKAGEFKSHKDEEEKEEVQQLHTKHPHPEPVIDHRLLAGKLTVFNWLKDVPSASGVSDIVEVRFKNTRKGFYSNPTRIPLKEGDIVAVEATLGHDIGIVSLTGELVKEQIRLKRIDLSRNPLKKIYRKAKPHDIEKWQQAIALEHDTMIRSRKIAANLKLNMKIGDVEYQGDKTKAIFYYIADDRVDFRTLIKVLAETFHIRIEMKQIGTRQEAGRIGGIGPCGRKLCCSTFITNFVSVSTSAARYQDISLNPQKLAGQCGKLKCCLNFEVDAYIDAQRDFPPTNIPLNTGDGMLYHQKTDIFGRTMSFTPDKEGKGIFIQIPVRRVKEIISMNRKGIIPPKALEESQEVEEDIKYTDGVGEESLNRFDEKKQQKRRHPKHRNAKDEKKEGKEEGRERRREGNRTPRREGSPAQTEGKAEGNRPPRREAAQGQTEGRAEGNRPQRRRSSDGQKRNNDGQRPQRPGTNANTGSRPREEGQRQKPAPRPRPQNEQNTTSES